MRKFRSTPFPLNKEDRNFGNFQVVPEGESSAKEEETVAFDLEFSQRQFFYRIFPVKPEAAGAILYGQRKEFPHQKVRRDRKDFPSDGTLKPSTQEYISSL